MKILLSAICLLCLGFHFSYAGMPAQIQSAADSATTVTISSEPSGASVYIDSVFVGVTPIVIDTLSHRRVFLRLDMPEYHSVQNWLRVNPDSVRLTLNIQMQLNYALVTIRSEEGSFLCSIDNIMTVAGPFQSRKISDGWHDLELTNRETGRTISSQVYLPPGCDTVFDARFSRPSLLPVVASIVIPGVASVMDVAPVEGAILFGAGTGFATAAALLNTSLMNRETEYHKAYDLYKNAVGETEAVDRRNSAQRAFDKIGSTRRLLNASIAAFAVTYAANLIEAFLSHAVKNTLVPVSVEKGVGTKTQSSLLLIPEVSDRTASLHFYCNF